MFRFFIIVFSLCMILALGAVGGALYLFWEYGKGLPDYHQLAHYEPPVTTRVYGGDGRLVAEYAVEKRAFVPIAVIPARVRDAFLSAEDKNFYSHPGIDFLGLTRAMVDNAKIIAVGSDRRMAGASTITQQVAKNFLLTNERKVERKIREAILSFRIERTFSKDHILELYLNEIYLGMGNYGVAAAGINYFNRGLDELTVAQAAYLAALPKAPNNYHPVRNRDAAIERRNWVIGRMYEDGKITREEYEMALQEPLVLERRDQATMIVGADYFAEDIRRDLAARYGENALYKGGLVVRSTVDAALQAHATKVLRDGLMAYDQKHGWRGPVAQLRLSSDWAKELAAIPFPRGGEPWILAVVLEVDNNGVDIGFVDGSRGKIPFSEMKWARPWIKGQRVGVSPKRPADVLKPGDVVLTELVQKSTEGKALPAKSFALRQIPAVEGGLVAIDPHTGRVLAMVGGWSYSKSQFNRASQALRQPGSTFKPFIYLTALENGYTPSSLVLDAPIALSQGPGLPLWKPKNYGNDFLGPTTLRVGLEKSRNLMTVRLAQAVGMDRIADDAINFGIYDRLPKVLAMSLGAGETTVLRLTAAYAQIVNGGKKITPTLVDRIQDRQGRTIFVHDKRFCDSCWPSQFAGQDMPRLPDIREQITDPVSAYQMTSILEGVVQRGTGRVVSSVGKPLAGKTGTSNNSQDAWFVGFSPDLAVGVYIGFDEPQTLGAKETGGGLAAPIFRDFMAFALEDKPATPFRVPKGVRLVRVDPRSGLPAMPGDSKAIWEAFKGNDMLPEYGQTVLDGSVESYSFDPLSGDQVMDGDLFMDDSSDNTGVEPGIDQSLPFEGAGGFSPNPGLSPYQQPYPQPVAPMPQTAPNAPVPGGLY